MVRHHQMPKCLYPWGSQGGCHHSPDVTALWRYTTLVWLSWSWEFVFFLFPSPFPPQLLCFPLSFCCLEPRGVAHSFLAAPPRCLCPTPPTASDEPAEPAAPNKSYVFITGPLCLRLSHILLKLKPVEAISSKATQITRNNNNEKGNKSAKLQKLSGMINPLVSGWL